MPDVNITTNSAHPHGSIDQLTERISDNQSGGSIGILAIYNSTNRPDALRAYSLPLSIKPVQGKLNNFIDNFLFILKNTTRILQNQYETHSTNDSHSEKRQQSPDIAMREYHIRKKIGVFKQKVLQRTGENLSGLYKQTFIRGGTPQINENVATLLFSAKKTIRSAGDPVLPTALAASQGMGHATERDSLLKKSLNPEKRLQADRRRRNIDPPEGIERRKADRRMRNP